MPQDPSDEPASELLKKIRVEKDRLIAEGKIKRDKSLAEITDEEKPFELPQGWEWARIPEIAHGLGQGEPTASFSYIDVAAIDNAKGRIAQDVQVLDATDAPSRARKNVAQGTVIYSTVRPYLKNIAVVEYEYVPRAIASTAFAVMHPHTGVLSKYLLHYLRSEPFTEFVNSKAVGVAYPAINDANFFQGVVALPPAAEQSRIVTRVEELMQLCDALEAQGQLEAEQHARLVSTLFASLLQSDTPEALAENWQRIATHFDLLLDRPEAVDALEQTILQLAVRGLLVPQDPTDEPASVLLQKIRTEKDQLIAQGKIKRDKPLPPITDEEKPFELPRGWEWARLPDIYFSISPSSNKLLSSAMLAEGKFPVVDQGQKHIAGYTNDEGMMIRVPGPVIVFGDHTKAIKFIDFDFVAGADGTKILRPLCQDERFFAFQLRSFSLEDRGYARHFKVLNSCLFALPPRQEQSRIVTRVTELQALCVELRMRLTASQLAQSHLADALVAQ